MNRARPDIKITLDKERTLRFDLNSMCAFENVTGRSMFDGTFQSDGMSAITMRAMLWSCLVGEDKDLTIEAVGAMISPDNMLDVAAKLGAAFEVSTQSEGEKKDPLAPKVAVIS